MFRQSWTRYAFLTKITKISKAPASGYELSELPNEKVLREFMQYHKTKGILVMLHNGDIKSAVTAGTGAPRAADAVPQVSSIAQDPLTRSFVSSINAMNMGNPEEVKLALVPGPMAPRLVEEYNILTYPTTLLFIDGRCVYRCVGARTRELSIKSLFMLRNAGRNIFTRA